MARITPTRLGGIENSWRPSLNGFGSRVDWTGTLFLRVSPASRTLSALAPEMRAR
jgi:hypothetical protein